MIHSLDRAGNDHSIDLSGSCRASFSVIPYGVVAESNLGCKLPESSVRPEDLGTASVGVIWFRRVVEVGRCVSRS